MSLVSFLDTGVNWEYQLGPGHLQNYFESPVGTQPTGVQPEETYHSLLGSLFPSFAVVSLEQALEFFFRVREFRLDTPFGPVTVESKTTIFGDSTTVKQVPPLATNSPVDYYTAISGTGDFDQHDRAFQVGLWTTWRPHYWHRTSSDPTSGGPIPFRDPGLFWDIPVGLAPAYPTENTLTRLGIVLYCGQVGDYIFASYPSTQGPTLITYVQIVVRGVTIGEFPIYTHEEWAYGPGDPDKTWRGYLPGPWTLTATKFWGYDGKFDETTGAFIG